MSKVVVTGFGIISALGDNAQANRKALLQEQSGVSRLEFVKTRYSTSHIFGEVKHPNSWFEDAFAIEAPGVTRTSLLSLHAFNEAISCAGLSQDDLKDHDTALVSANTVGGMCLTDQMYHDANQKEVGSEYVKSYDAGASTIFLLERFGMKGPANTINTACSSSANAIAFGANLIRSRMCKRAIVGGVDSLAKFTINGFNSLHILAEKKSRPFDKNREGLNLGEGAAYLVLEREEDCQDKAIYARFSGAGNSNDAYHASALSEHGDGPFLAMQRALQSAKLEPDQISYINAHGTGTENNDLAESAAMIRLFSNVPSFSSTKAYTGHTLGAAGAVEAVFSILALIHQEVYPNLHFENEIPETKLCPVSKTTKMAVEHVMSNSFGFGGNCSSLIFSKP